MLTKYNKPLPRSNGPFRILHFTRHRPTADEDGIRNIISSDRVTVLPESIDRLHGYEASKTSNDDNENLRETNTTSAYRRPPRTPLIAKKTSLEKNSDSPVEMGSKETNPSTSRTLKEDKYISEDETLRIHTDSAHTSTEDTNFEYVIDCLVGPHKTP